MSRNHAERAIIPLLLVIAIDSMGFGFVFPVLTPMFLQGHSSILPIGTSPLMHDFLYGLVVAVYPFCMFFGAPILGDLSDHWGRKKVLFICLLGTGIGYLLSGIGVSTNHFSLLILGRIVDGLTAGSLPMAQAAIADVSTNEKRQAKYMGLMMFAIAGGQVIGPFFAGFFSDVHILPIFSNSLPFYLAIVLTIFNIIWLMWAFRETYIPVVKKELSITATLRSFRVVITSKNLLLVSIVFLCMQLSWSFYSQASPAYLQAVFHYSNFMLGMFSASLGVFIAVGGTLVMPQLVKWVTAKYGALIAFAMMMIGILIGVAFNSQWMFWIGLIVNTIGAALAFSFIITLFSSLVDETRQGWVMGITGSIIAIAWACTALLTGVLIIFSKVIAEYLACLLALAGMYFVSRFHKSSQPEKI